MQDARSTQHLEPHQPLRRYSKTRGIPFLLAAFTAAYLACLPVRALTVLPLSLDELIANSNNVVKGEVLSSAYRAEGGTVATTYELAVEEVLGSTGDLLVGSHTYFRVLGGVREDGIELVVPGVPAFSKGQKVCLFLRPTPTGATIVGYFLGAYEVVRAADGTETLRRLHPTGINVLQHLEIPEALPAPDTLDLQEIRLHLRNHPGVLGARLDKQHQPKALVSALTGKTLGLSGPKSPKSAQKLSSVPRGTLWPCLAIILPLICCYLRSLIVVILRFLRASPYIRAASFGLLAVLVFHGGLLLGFVREEVGGKPVYWPDSKIPLAWYMNPDPTADCLYEFDAITASFQVWEAVPTSRLTFYFAASPPYEDDRYDGYNILFWTTTDPKGYFDAGTLAVTLYWANPLNGQLLDADIVFNDRDYAWTTRPEGGSGWVVECVGTHEIGHLFGLGHTSIPEATMYSYYHDGADTLHQDDADGISAIYPEAISQPPPSWQRGSGGCSQYTATRTIRMRGLYP